MTDQEEIEGIALSCGLDGTIQQVVIDRLGLTGQAGPGKPLEKALAAAEPAKLQDFLREVMARNNVFDREISVLVGGRQQTLHLLGARTGDTLLVMAARSRSEVVRLSWELGRGKDIHAGALKDALVGYTLQGEHARAREANLADENKKLNREVETLRVENAALKKEVEALKGEAEGLREGIAQVDAGQARRSLFYRALFEQDTVGVCFSDLAGNFVEFNRRFAALTGRLPAELAGKTFRDITHPEDLDIGQDQVRQLLDGKINSYTVEKRFRHRDSRSVYVRVSVSLARGRAGESLYFVSLVEAVEGGRGGKST